MTPAVLVQRVVIFTCGVLLYTPVTAYENPPVEPGFVSLFDGKDWTRDFEVHGERAAWTVVDGILIARAGGHHILSKKPYDNFVLRLEWSIAKGGNSGVFVHVPDPDDERPWVTGHEIQISDERPRRKPIHTTGAIYGRVPSTAGPIAPDVWHDFEILCLGGSISVHLDGKLVCDGNAAKDASLKGSSQRGHVGLQDYHHSDGKTVKYRNIRIQPLNADGTVKGFKDITNEKEKWQKITTGHGSGGRWILEDGVWSGEQDPPGSGNGGILVHKDALSNFEVVFETRPDWGVCSGFFLRSTLKGECYQLMVDYHDHDGNIAGVYGEGTGGFVHRSYTLDANKNLKLLEKPEGTPPKLRFEPAQWERYWDKSGWNEIRARIRGNPPTVESWLNGTYISRFVDDEKRIPDAGHVGIQVHGGKGWPKGKKVRFRKIRVRSLP